MKKIVFILSFVFVAGLSVSTFANQITVDSDVKITIVEDVDDEKPCKKDCTCVTCKEKAAKAEKCTKKTDVKCCAKTKEACPKTKEACCKKKSSCDKKAGTTTTPEEKKK